MRIDILPLCDKHYRTMEFCIAPFNADYSIEFFVCTDKFCHRCFSERLGYCTPIKDHSPLVQDNQPRCEIHGRPMFISSLDRQRNHVKYLCSEPECQQSVMRG